MRTNGIGSREMAAGLACLALAFVSVAAFAGESLAPLEIVHPRNGAVFPIDIARPTFRWLDKSAASLWELAFDLPGEGPVVEVRIETPSWKPSQELWESIRHRSLEHDARLRIRGIDGIRRQPVSEASLVFRTSADPVGAPIFYREVPLPVEKAARNLHLVRWRFGPVSSESPPRVVLENMATCANCHSFSADGGTLAMDVDKENDKGSYLIVGLDRVVRFGLKQMITWNDFEPEEGNHSYGFLSRISPDGRYVASTVKEQGVHLPLPDPYCPQLFFLFRGILVVYDRAARRFSALRGADDRDFVQTNPSWSPDGEWIVFARSPKYEIRNPVDARRVKNVITDEEARRVFVEGGAKFRYDLYRVPFRGGAGGEIEAIPGASLNGRSNYFARFSPDGRWIVFCQSASFMLNQPDSDLHILPAKGGEPRRLLCNTADRMDSWHSWSPNGKWLVFASKADGPFTQLWLTHIDEQGMDSPAVLLERFSSPGMAANLPEFVNVPPDGLLEIRPARQFIRPPGKP